MSMELWQRLKDLEKRVLKLEQEKVEPEKVIEAIKQLHDSQTLASKPADKVAENKTRIEANRKLCPKCGVKPNHFFHVRSCTG